MISRAAALAAASVGAALAHRMLWYEPRRGVVRRHTLALPRWPAELVGLRVALISDLHAGAPHVDEACIAALVARANREAADLVVLLGDFVDEEVAGARPVAPEAVARALGRLHPRLGTVAVLGNHDWRTDGERVARALRANAITVLENDAIAVGDGRHRLWIAGVADATERHADVDAALRCVDADQPVILLSHHPDVFPRVPARVALTLAGHTHGGQVAIPLLRRLVIPSRFGERFVAGPVVEDGRHLWVTSGVGTSGWPIRFLAPPEIVVLTLMAR